jgi:hypothetical protein
MTPKKQAKNEGRIAAVRRRHFRIHSREVDYFEKGARGRVLIGPAATMTWKLSPFG